MSIGNPSSDDELPKLLIMRKNFFRKVFGVLMVLILQIFHWILPYQAGLLLISYNATIIVS